MLEFADSVCAGYTSAVRMPCGGTAPGGGDATVPPVLATSGSTWTTP